MPGSSTVFVGIGSNMGDKTAQCRLAVERMNQIPGCRVAAVSPFFGSEPVGVVGQDWYVNAVAELEVEIPARRLLEALLAIEAGMGRVRLKKWDSRPIDLDILIFGKEVIDEADLSVPHPLMHTRRFVLAPLAALAAEWVHPVLNMTVQALLDRLPSGEQAVSALEE
ncbi:2-amino-4-hydroxy-6-hydroxymethyldihydropteridine diphosphokinase [Desulfatiglans anilini]|uniref:2-amino-4-hydroxy-6- hydroxymethyldihydropteridine diphosphokinase n=1 Tax=Desulfatiglans anilini TaxID=90728 RepID=UPI0004133F26|nr:2-amino-4-hydroxy-6-hydroxymethyldihydropteridine diphosphokinase [Desulfatiglans anilini]